MLKNSFSVSILKKGKKMARSTNNESGFVLVLSLIILVIMSLLAVFATNISNIEIQTSTNNEKFQTAFFLGEGVAVEGVGVLNNEAYDKLISHNPYLTGLPYTAWLNTHPIYFSGGTGADLTDADSWDVGGVKITSTALTDQMDEGGLRPPGFDTANDHLAFAVQDTGVAAGYDESSNPQVRAYFLYGFYDVGRQSAFPGKNIIELGYRMPLTQPESL